jgi:hypothetical protein
MRQKKLTEVRIEIPFNRLTRWKNFPVSQDDASDILKSVRDDLEEALARIEIQIADLKVPE